MEVLEADEFECGLLMYLDLWGITHVDCVTKFERSVDSSWYFVMSQLSRPN